MTADAVTLGCDRLLASDRLVGRRVGLVANPASVNGGWQHTADRLAARSDVTLAALFGPQHGFLSSDQDNMIETAHARHPRLDVPVYSLYSDTREPAPEMLADLDVLVVDLQDVGTRVYTYVYTMANCLRAARARDLPVVVCDRPNPIGGLAIEGPMLEPGFTSFVGQFPIPLRHGLTVGELARLFNDTFGLDATLEVVEMTGWRRSMYHDETGLPWILPSPNLPTLDSAIVYPGGVLFEGDDGLRGPWNHPSVRAARRAGGGGRRVVRAALGAGPAGRPLSSGRLRADVPEARGSAVRRVPDPRPGSRRVRAGPDRGRRDAGPAPPAAGRPGVAGPALRVRAGEAADRHPVRLRPPPRAARRGRGERCDRGLVARRRERVQGTGDARAPLRLTDGPGIRRRRRGHGHRHQTGPDRSLQRRLPCRGCGARGRHRRRAGPVAGTRSLVGTPDRPPPGRQRDDERRAATAARGPRPSDDPGLRPGPVRRADCSTTDPLEASLEAFRLARLTTAELLDRLDDDAWERAGDHPEHDRYTVDVWLEIYAAHAHDHAEQIRRARASA